MLDAQQVGRLAENVTQSLREALLIGADQDGAAKTDFRAADNTIECGPQLREKVQICSIVSISVLEHGPHEGRMRSRIVSDDGSALIHDDRNKARAEIKGPVHAED